MSRIKKNGVVLITKCKIQFAECVKRKKIVVIWLMLYEQMLFINGENGLIELLPSPFQLNVSTNN